jgi:hypothetical protein
VPVHTAGGEDGGITARMPAGDDFPLRDIDGVALDAHEVSPTTSPASCATRGRRLTSHGGPTSRLA